MRRRRGIDIVDLIVHLAFFLIGLAVLFPVFARGRDNARRSACQNNLRQIIMACQQYTADNDGQLPSSNWEQATTAYIKGDAAPVFQCRATYEKRGTSDYFFNSRFLGTSLQKISSPNTLILLGDGRDDAPLGETLAALPSGWLKDQSSPAWRHLGTANYAFADGHVKALNPKAINRDFRVVLR